MLPKILTTFIKLISLVLICFSISFRANANSSYVLDEFHDFSYAIIQIEINNIPVDDYIDSYDTIYGHFYSLKGLTNALGFDISYDLFAPNAQGWIYDKNNLFIYNGEKREFIIGKDKLSINKEKIVYRDNEIYITVAEFARIMDMRYVYQEDKLLLKLFSQKVTPVEQRLLLQKKYRDLQKRQGEAQEQVVLEPDIEFSYKLISAPILDFKSDLDYAYSESTVSDSESNDTHDDGLSGNVETYLRNNFLYMDSELYVNYDRDESINAKLFSLKRDDRDAGLLGPIHATNVEVGDLDSDVGEGIGVYLTNQDANSTNRFNETRIVGTGYDGWRVELYVNNILIDSKVIGADGRYEFDNVQMSYNSNHIEIIKYGDHGEVEREVRRYNLSNNLLKTNKLFYNFQYIKANDYLLGEQDDDTTDLTSDDNYYLKLGKRINDFNSIYYERVLENAEQDSNIITWVNSTKGVANYFSYEQDDYDNSKTIGVSSLFEMADKNIEAKLDYQFVQNDSGDQNILDVEWSQDFEKFNYNISTTIQDNYGDFTQVVDLSTAYNFNNCLRLYNSLNYSEGSTEAGATLRCFLKQQWFGASVNYDIEPSNNLDSITLSYNNTKIKDLTYNFDFTYSDDSTDGTNWYIENELLYRLYKLMKAGTYLNYYDENQETVVGLTLNLNGSVSLVHNPSAKSKMSLITGANTARGILGVRSFLDANYNNFFDEGDEALEGVIFQGSGVLIAPSDSNGVSFYHGLSKYSVYPVAVNYKYLDNVDITAPQETINVKIMSSKVNYIDYAFVYYGYVDGNLHLGDLPLAGIKVVLNKLDGTRVAEYITESDGYFYLSNIPVGDYLLQISETSYQTLEMTEKLDYPVEVTKDNLFVENLDPNLFGKVSQRIYDYFFAPKVKVAEVVAEPEVVPVEEKKKEEREKPVNIAVFSIKPMAKPEIGTVEVEEEPQFILFKPLNLLSDSKGFDPRQTPRSKAIPMPETDLIFGSNNDAAGLYEVEIAESNRKSEVIKYMIDFKRTYPQTFVSLALKIHMEDRARDNIYKLKTLFDQDAAAAIEYCQRFTDEDVVCKVEKETKIVGRFATKEDAFNYRDRMALDGILNGKDVYLKRYDEQTESEVKDLSVSALKGKENLVKEYITYLGGVNYELIIVTDNLYDQSIDKFCDKYQEHLSCSSEYITNHGIEKYKVDLHRSGLTKKTVFDMYDVQVDDNIWYRLTTGEFANTDKAYDFCNSIGIVDEKCIVYERTSESSILVQ